MTVFSEGDDGMTIPYYHSQAPRISIVCQSPEKTNGNAVVPMELMGIWAKIGAPSHFLQPLRP